MKGLWIIFLLIGGLFGQNDVALKKHNISLGMLDDKTGFSFFSYTYNLKQTEMDEYFIGGGTMVLAFTGSAGWKHYFKKSKYSVYSVLSGQGVMHFGFAGFIPSVSLGVESSLTEKLQFKLGVSLFSMVAGTNTGDTGILPFIGLTRRF